MPVAKSGLRVPGTKFHSFRDSLIIEGARVQCRKQMGEHRRVDVCEHTSYEELSHFCGGYSKLIRNLQ